MSFSLKPVYVLDRLSRLTPEKLKELDICLLLLDLDNTISPYGVPSPEAETIEWAENMKKGGITLFIVSNSKKARPEVFAKAMDIPFVNRAKKPSPRFLNYAMEKTGIPPEKTALAGDQIFTDTLAANLAGVRSILVEPIKFTNPFLAVRYYMETPFRKMYKTKL